MSEALEWVNELGRQTLELRQCCQPPDNVDELVPWLKAVNDKTAAIVRLMARRPGPMDMAALMQEPASLDEWTRPLVSRVCAMGLRQVIPGLVSEITTPLWRALLLRSHDANSAWSEFVSLIHDKGGPAVAMHTTLTTMAHLPPLSGWDAVSTDIANANASGWLLSRLPLEMFSAASLHIGTPADVLRAVDRIHKAADEEHTFETHVPIWVGRHELPDRLLDGYTIRWVTVWAEHTAVQLAKNTAWRREALQGLVRFTKETR